ncbi:MAG: hypothetical protein PHX12_05990 [Proteiniphilum sp.]|nr:hypothetical protein [Proteiniphilum sp.]
MINKSTIVDYVKSLTGASSVTIDDASYQNGMEDVVRKSIMFSPDLLKELETEIDIEAAETTLKYVLPTLKVFKGNNECIRVNKLQHIANTHSLLNDLGNTQYYMLVGNKLTLHPAYDGTYEPGYRYRDIKYGVVPGEDEAPSTALDWSDKLSYPLSLYLGVLHLLDAIDVELGEAVDDTAAIADATLPDGTLSKFVDLDVLEAGFTFPTMESIRTSEGETITFDASVTPQPPTFRQDGESADIEANLAFTPSFSLSKMDEVSAIVGNINNLNITAPTTNPAWPEGFEELDISGLLPTIDLTGLPTVTDGDFIVPTKPDIDLPTEAELEELGEYGFINTDNYDTHYLSTLFQKAESRLASDDVELAHAEIENIKTYLAERATKTQEYSTNVQIYLSKFEAYKTAIAGYEADVNAWAVGLKEYDTKIQVFQGQLQGYNAQLQNAAATINEYEGNIQKYVAETGKYNADIQNYVSQIQQARMLLEQASAYAQEASVNVSIYQAELQTYVAENEAFLAEVQAYNAKVGGYVAEIQDYNARVSKYSQDIAEYSTRINAASMLINKYSAELQGVSSRVAVFGAEAERASVLSSFLIGRDNSLANKLQSRVKFIESMFGRVSELNKRYNEFFMAPQPQEEVNNESR